MSEVHNVMYSCVDYADNQHLETFSDEDDAKEYARECAREQLDDNLDMVEEGYTIEERTTDEGHFEVTLNNPEGYEVEWWRVETRILR